MSASPASTAAVPSTKRPLEDPSSPSAPTDLPDAKRPALDKVVRDDTGIDGAEATDLSVADIPTAEEDHAPAAATTTAAATTAATATATTTTAATATGAADVTGETTPPAPNGTAQVAVPEPQPIPSTASHHDGASSQASASMPPQDETNWIHIRAVISSSEAATCIGKGGENVTQIRRLSGAKCTVSDYSRGAVERILTVSGAQDAVAKVCFPS